MTESSFFSKNRYRESVVAANRYDRKKWSRSWAGTLTRKLLRWPGRFRYQDQGFVGIRWDDCYAVIRVVPR